MDLYLIEGCRRVPDLSRFAPQLGAAVIGLAARCAERRPGFLRLDLAPAEADALLAALRGEGARGSAVRSRYREGSALPMEQAWEIADRALDMRVQRDAPAVRFDDTRFVREEALWWVFCRPSPQLIDQGVVPGALFAAVDKLDGHLWSDEAQSAFFEAA